MQKRNGFTLIELLAVIVILGLLMAIAIPSVTKYITESRRKTLIKTVDSYITAVVNQVNDGDYSFSDEAKIFALPIECIQLEKGGSDPFGEWLEANDNYWAYVLVQYDSENYNYIYGFTFKDSAGYGMYPTSSANIKEKGTQVRTGYDDLVRPKTGEAINFVSLDKWNGFDVTNTTELVVLEAELEGVTGDGKTTCTLCQKGNNYEVIAEEKKSNLSYVIKLGDYVKMTPTSTSYTVIGKTTVINPSELNLWRVIKKNDNGTIELVSEYTSSKSFSFQGMKDYSYYVGYLNAIASQYENVEYTIGSRAIGYNGQTSYLDYESLKTYNNSFSWSGNVCGTTTVDNSKESIGCGDIMYVDDINLIQEALGTLKALKKGSCTTCYGDYWISSRHFKYNPSGSMIRLTWGLRVIRSDGDLSWLGIQNNCTPNGCIQGTSSYNFRPIVILKANLKVIGGDGSSSSPYEISNEL